MQTCKGNPECYLEVNSTTENKHAILFSLKFRDADSYSQTSNYEPEITSLKGNSQTTKVIFILGIVF